MTFAFDSFIPEVFVFAPTAPPQYAIAWCNQMQTLDAELHDKDYLQTLGTAEWNTQM